MSLVGTLAVLSCGRDSGFERRANRASILRRVQLLPRGRCIVLLCLAILAGAKINLRLTTLLEDGGQIGHLGMHLFLNCLDLLSLH